MTLHQPYPSHTPRCLGATALTSVDVLSRTVTLVPYPMYMKLDDAEDKILTLVSCFNQLPTAYIKTLVYPGKSGNPQRWHIEKLVKFKLLVPVEERLSGSSGGNSMFVYQLGRQGWSMYRKGRYRYATTINRHTLAIAKTHVLLHQARHDRLIKILNYATEPDCHYEVGGIKLEPDLFEDVVVRATSLRQMMWIEVDRATEGKVQILKKVADYVAAYEHKGQFPLPQYPTVKFLAKNEDNADNIRYWLQGANFGNLPDNYFTVGTVDEVLEILQRQ